MISFLMEIKRVLEERLRAREEVVSTQRRTPRDLRGTAGRAEEGGCPAEAYLAQGAELGQCGLSWALKEVPACPFQPPSLSHREAS